MPSPLGNSAFRQIGKLLFPTVSVEQGLFTSLATLVQHQRDIALKEDHCRSAGMKWRLNRASNSNPDLFGFQMLFPNHQIAKPERFFISPQTFHHREKLTLNVARFLGG